MRHQTRFTALGAALATLPIVAANLAMQTSRAVPETLKPPADQMLAFELLASGFQIYECKPVKDDPARYEWAFKAPQAELFNPDGKLVGKHYGGPTWEGLDGSKVVGEVKVKDTSLAGDSIPWLLLGATSTSGTGLFSGITSIQRLETKGGAAPATAGPGQAGQEAKVPYSATYAFYVARP